MPSKQTVAARVVRVLAWIQIAVPLGAVVVLLPGSLFLLLLGGIIVVAPPVALGVIGLGIAKGLRRGHRELAAVALSTLQAGAYILLALHSITWDADTQGGANFFLLVRIVFWLAAAANVSVLVILAAPAREPTTERVEATEQIPDLKPSLWPWLVAAAVILALIALGIPVAGRG